MSVRHLLAAADAALLGGFALAAPVAAPSVYAMSPGRIAAFVAAGAGLIGIVVGGLGLTRPAGRFGTRNGPRGAFVALVAGLIGVIVGGLVVATADGGLGTGNGLGGGIVALVLGLIGMVVGGLALARSRRTG